MGRIRHNGQSQLKENAKELIFVVEDEESIRELYAYTAQNAGYKIECFESGAALFARLPNQIPDLFILDIMLDGMDGYEILSKIKAENRLASIPVIMVSAKGEEINKVKGLDLGADDYIAKPFGVLELVARIKAQLRKTKKSKVASYKDITVDDVTHAICVGKGTINCTLKEYNLLKLLVENAQTVLSRDEIFNAVWGEEYFGETRTLDMHVNELRKLLTEKQSTAKIETVRGVGYVLK